MPIPAWSSATPGQATLAGQLNQFLVPHASTFTYAGSALALTSSNPTPVGSTADSLTSNNALAYRFQTSSSAVQLSRVTLALGVVGSGVDVLMTLQSDSGTGPSGTTLAQCYIPAEWLPTGVSTTLTPSHGFPLSYTLAANTYYNIVLSVVNASSTSNVTAEWTRTTSGVTSGALTQNAAGTWTTQSYGYSIGLYGGTSGLLEIVTDDTQSKMTGFSYVGTQVTTIRQWVAKSSSAPQNLLARDDAAFTTTTGNMAGTNCSVALVTTPVYYGSHSLKMTSTASTFTYIGAYAATLNSSSGSGVTYVPVTVGNNYSAVCYIAPNSTLRNVYAQLNFYNSSGTVIGSSIQGTYVSQTAANTFTQCTVSATAPTGAITCLVTAVVSAASGDIANGEIHYLGAMGLFSGSNTTWSYPGLGVASSRTLAYSSSTTGSPVTSMS